MPGQKLLPPGKYYICFQIGEKTTHAAQCHKTYALTKVIDFIMEIE